MALSDDEGVGQIGAKVPNLGSVAHRLVAIPASLSDDDSSAGGGPTRPAARASPWRDGAAGRLVRQPGKRRCKAWEVFSGQGGLTKALRLKGFDVTPVDVRLEPTLHDLSDPHVFDSMSRQIEHDPELRYVHFAPPCATYSNARWPRLRLGYQDLGGGQWR